LEKLRAKTARTSGEGADCEFLGCLPPRKNAAFALLKALTYFFWNQYRLKRASGIQYIIRINIIRNQRPSPSSD